MGIVERLRSHGSMGFGAGAGSGRGRRRRGRGGAGGGEGRAPRVAVVREQIGEGCSVFCGEFEAIFCPPPLKFGFLQPEDAEKLCFAFVLYCVSKLKETKAGSSGVRLWEILKGCKLKWVMLCYNGF